MKFLIWLSDHFNLIAWPSLVILAWKASAKIKGYMSRVEDAESTVTLIATNHLPHIQSELESMNSKLENGFDKIADGLDNLRDILLIMNSRDTR